MFGVAPMGNPSDGAVGYVKNQEIRTDSTAKEKLEVSFQQKRECFDRAKTFVEQLLEQNITEEFLLHSVHYISQEDYNDVVEERSIIKICGYPVCNNELGPMPNKRFHISTTSNKVYDITERKVCFKFYTNLYNKLLLQKFCSNWCYKASLYLKDQVLTSPVWYRGYEAKPSFRLLPKEESCGSAGQEIALKLEQLHLSEKIEERKPTVSSFGFSHLEQYQNDGIFTCDSLHIKESFVQESQFASKTHVQDSPPEQRRQRDVTCGRANGGNIDLSQYEIPREPKPEVLPKCKATNQQAKQPIPQPEAAAKPALNIQDRYFKERENMERAPVESQKSIKPIPIREPVVKFSAEKVSTFIREWFTLETLFFILGPYESYQRLLAKVDALNNESREAHWRPTVEEKLLQLCRKNEEQPEEDRAACTELELKVAAFFKGRTSYQETTSSNPVLPTVDKYEQKQARHKLVMTRLDKVVPELVDILRLNKNDFSEKLQKLLGTFEFSAHNVMMKPPEWNLTGLVMIKLLTDKDPGMKKCRRGKKNAKILRSMLESMNLRADFLDVLLENLCDIDRILSQTNIVQQ